MSDRTVGEGRQLGSPANTMHTTPGIEIMRTMADSEPNIRHKWQTCRGAASIVATVPTVTAKQSRLRPAPTADHQYDLPRPARQRSAHREGGGGGGEGEGRRIRYWFSHRLVEVVRVWLAIGIP